MSDDDEMIEDLKGPVEPVIIEAEMMQVLGKEEENINYVCFTRISGDPFTFAHFYEEAQNKFLYSFNDFSI
jgi:hypothetical protein